MSQQINRPPGLLDRLTAIERRVLEDRIADYYSGVAEEEVASGKVASDRDFPTVARIKPMRILHEVTLGCTAALLGTILWTTLVDRFSG